MKATLRKIAMPLLRFYWKVFKPKTYGVKILIKHPQRQNEFLLVQHSYGDQSLWNLPGGGYRPTRETPIAAAIREIRQELSCELVSPKIIGLYETSGEGKKDTVTIILGSIEHLETIKTQDEISQISWKNTGWINTNKDVSRVTKYAIKIFTDFQK